MGANASLRNRLDEFIQEITAGLEIELREETSLIRSGLVDSLALLQLAEWIERETGAPLDVTAIDLATRWDTMADILTFIHGSRGRTPAQRERDSGAGSR